MLPGYNEPFPSRDVIVKKSRKASDTFIRYSEQSVEQRLARTPFRVQPFDTLTDVSASGSGTIATDQISGVYRVSVYREVTTADPVSSSLAVSVQWTHNGKALTRTLPAFGAAPQTVNDSAGDATVIEIDPGTPISYTYTYASNTAGLARFDLTIGAELLQAIEEA